MRKLAGLGALAAASVAMPAAAQPCTGTAFLVSVSGFKTRTGTVRVLTFAGEESYTNGRPRVSRFEVPVPAQGPATLCVRLPAARDYAVSVRHDVNGNGESDRGDGGGFSRNPRMSLGMAISRRNPAYATTRIDVAEGAVVRVPITLNYLRGLSIGPVANPA